MHPVHGKNPDIICFQELKCNLTSGQSFVNALPSYRNVLSLDPGVAATHSPAKAGVSISFHNSLNVTYLDRRVEPGWLLVIKCRIQDRVFVVANAYINPHLNDHMYRNKLEIIDGHLKKMKCENVILMGDFNNPLSEQDCCSGWENCRTIAKRATVLNSFLDRWEIQDTWRVHHPYDKNFTHRTQGQGDSRQLDFVFILLNYMCFVSECTIGFAYCSDHSPIHTTLLFGDPPEKRQFIFPVDLCYSKQFKLQLKENIVAIKKENSEANPHVLWELIKSTIRATALKFKKYQVKLRKEIVEEFEAKIAQQVHELDREQSLLLRKGRFEEIAKLQTGLDSMFQEGRALKYAANLAKWYSERNKDSKYFLNKFRLDKSKPVIAPLVMNKGTVTQNSAILKEAHTFYQKLYSQDQITLPSGNSDNPVTISTDDKKIMVQDISINGLYTALKSM